MARQRHLLLLFIHLLLFSFSIAADDDATIMTKLLKSIFNPPATWGADKHFCDWEGITCDYNSSSSRRVTSINLYNKSLSGTLPPDLNNLSRLETLDLVYNEFTGPLPTLANLTLLRLVYLSGNFFTSIPQDFFSGLTNLQNFSISFQNNLAPWVLPDNIAECTSLRSFEASSASLTGSIPESFTSLPNLQYLSLSFNDLSGSLPFRFNNLSRLENLYLQDKSLSGPLPTFSNLTLLRHVFIRFNKFTSIPPDFFHGLTNLQDFDISANSFLAPWFLPNDLTHCTNLQLFSAHGTNVIGSIPYTFDGLSNLQFLDLSENNLNGSLPSQLNKLNNLIKIDLSNNSFSGALPTLSDLDKLETLIIDNNKFNSIPGNFFSGLTGLTYFEISNNSNLEPWDLPNNFGEIYGLESFIAVNASITGLIPEYSNGSSLETIHLSYNNLTGAIPASFAMSSISDLQLDNQLQGLSGTLDIISSMYQLRYVQLEANDFSGPIPDNLTRLPYLQLLDVSHNNISGYIPKFEHNVTFLYSNTSIRKQSSSRNNSSLRVVSVIVSVLTLAGIVLLVFYKYHVLSRKSRIPITGSHGEIPISENGNVMVSMQLLELVTDNFSDNNVLGRGGFGTVYKGELLDGTKIAVKKMKSDVNGAKGIKEFQAEIGVLTRVRHRHLVALLGYCINDNERLLVYEYMPRGTLSQHLFKWREHKSQPLSWNQRVSIALDVGRGVEYMHSLAQQSFIHRDLKPANILLDDDLRAKVADFGLVKNAPDGKYSIETRLAGTFGYLAPEYAITGRVTTKVDVYAFGVILMQLITGRKAIDGSMPDERYQLVTWFRMVPICKENMMKFIDRVFDTDSCDTLESILKVAELAHYCTAPEPFQRPNMGYVVAMLGQLVEEWNPSRHKDGIAYGHKHNMSLPEMLQDNEDTTRLLNLFRSNSF
uniref:receptor-like kinase TMK4 n=1 Tax=Erigeron canadensis TaxID=72917 RepID=UPI001CB92171|nr:receptor-like kinase TMK4 [Erigeron canadensis]